MPEPRIKTRPTGATASLGRTGFPHVVSVTGGTIDIVTGPSQPGFNPIDLLYASLSACLAMSARVAASQIGVLDRITRITVSVKGEKATDGPGRVQAFAIAFTIAGDIDQQTRETVARVAEEICTVSNTLRGDPEITTTVAAD